MRIPRVFTAVVVAIAACLGLTACDVPEAMTQPLSAAQLDQAKTYLVQHQNDRINYPIDTNPASWQVGIIVQEFGSASGSNGGSITLQTVWAVIILLPDGSHYSTFSEEQAAWSPFNPKKHPDAVGQFVTFNKPHATDKPGLSFYDMIFIGTAVASQSNKNLSGDYIKPPQPGPFQ